MVVEKRTLFFCLRLARLEAPLHFARKSAKRAIFVRIQHSRTSDARHRKADIILREKSRPPGNADPLGVRVSSAGRCRFGS